MGQSHDYPVCISKEFTDEDFKNIRLLREITGKNIIAVRDAYKNNGKKIRFGFIRINKMKGSDGYGRYSYEVDSGY